MRRTVWVLILLALAPLGWAQDDAAPPIVGGSYTLAAGDTWTGDLNAFGATVTLEPGSTVNGHVTAIGGRVIVNGTVSQDVQVYGGELVLGEQARVEGAVTTNWAAFERAAGATVAGALDTESGRPIRFSLPRTPREPTAFYTRAAQPNTLLGVLPRSLGLAVLAAVLMLLVPRSLARVEEAMIKRPARSAGVGLLAALAAMLVLTVLAITLIGIPLALVGAFLLFAAVMYGWIAFGSAIGSYLARAFQQSWSPALRAFFGTFALALVVFVLGYLPPLGGLVQFLLALVALGAVVLTRFGSRAYLPPAAGPHQPAVPPARA